VLVEYMVHVQLVVIIEDLPCFIGEEGELSCNVNACQWVVVTELQSCLQTFMVAQKLLEGYAYSTISFIPYLIDKVRSNLLSLKIDPTSSPHVLSILARMLEKMDELFGNGAEGTVAAAFLPMGPRQ
jgi:hypothetical protein